MSNELTGKLAWYLSKGIWTGIITAALGIYDAAVLGLASGCATGGLCYHLPLIPNFVFVLLGAFGIYSRNIASQKIG